MGICRFPESIDIYQSLHNLCHLVASLELKRSKIGTQFKACFGTIVITKAGTTIVVKTNGPFSSIWSNSLQRVSHSNMIKLCRFSHEEKEIFFSSKMYIDVSNIYHSKFRPIYHMPHHVKNYTNAIRPMVRCIWIKSSPEANKQASFQN